MNRHCMANGGLGLDLDPTGRTLNDPAGLDGDAGANGLQKWSTTPAS